MEYPDIQYFENYIKATVKGIKDITYNIFKQTWATSECGWDEPGSVAFQVLTEDFTTVATIITEDKPVYLVCFGEEFAYMIEEPKSEFFADVANHCVQGLYEAMNTDRY